MKAFRGVWWGLVLEGALLAALAALAYGVALVARTGVWRAIAPAWLR